MHIFLADKICTDFRLTQYELNIVIMSLYCVARSEKKMNPDPTNQGKIWIWEPKKIEIQGRGPEKPDIGLGKPLKKKFFS